LKEDTIQSRRCLAPAGNRLYFEENQIVEYDGLCTTWSGIDLLKDFAAAVVNRESVRLGTHPTGIRQLGMG
jgi:hypothetical protein